MTGCRDALPQVMNAPALSVLDLVPVRTGQTSAQAVAASLDLAARADELGYRRYWFAEHHNMPAVASTSPPVLAAVAAARTRRIRVGSGGVMLPNHSPLVVAEQFAALEAVAPGRIDLGIGRAPGSDPVIPQLLRMSGTTSDVDRFPDHIRDILALTSPEGATVRLTGRPDGNDRYAIHATPAATGMPELWLLGSSDYSAQLAAAFGLPYVFANHFSGDGLERGQRATAAQARHHAGLRQHPLLRLLRGRGDDGVRGEERARRGERLGRLEVLPVQVEGPLESLAGEVVREHVRQAEGGGELGGVVG